ncbi:MAG: ATP-binding protein [Leucobacter sp.]
MDTLQIAGKEYAPRVLDQALQQALSISGAVVIEGARACGKTMTALNAAGSFAFIDDPSSQQLLEIAPDSLLDGDAPRLLDEWQLAPELWNLVRRRVDAAVDPGRFILTGSAVPADDATRHTGAGRFLRLHQRTLSWWEKQQRPAGGVSLASLFAGERPVASADSALDLESVIALVLQSGFPAMAGLEPQQSAQLLRAYIGEVARTDIHRLANIRQDPETITGLITALARTVSSETKYSTLATDLRTTAPSITAESVRTYVSLLQRLFIVEEQLAWTPKLRSRARLRTSPKLHLVDPALAAAALGADTKRLRGDLETLGLLFESAAVHDLNIYASALEGEVRHYRDSNGKEIDAVITLPDSRWAAIEVKLGGLQIPKALKSLTSAVSEIEPAASGQPSFKLIITGNGPTLTLDDGTITCPLATLKP